MKWSKEMKPWRAELVRDIDLSCDGKVIATASKENPVLGTVTHYGYKKIGKNNVRMCLFHPDVAPEKQWDISRKWLKMMKNQEKDSARTC